MQRLLDAAGGDGEAEEPLVKTGGAPKVLEDGTYATETAMSSAAAARLEAVKKATKPPLRGDRPNPQLVMKRLSSFQLYY
jgi:coatomer subunit beta